jgi:hypothetical protein
MDKPKVGKCYVFVRAKGSSLEHTEFTRHEDGSAGFAADGFMHVHEGGPEAWRGALEELVKLGFEELTKAQSRGAVPADWRPSTGTHVLTQANGKPHA